jgi:hypothetical protein
MPSSELKAAEQLASGQLPLQLQLWQQPAQQKQAC